VDAFPIGIDPDRFRRALDAAEVKGRVLEQQTRECRDEWVSESVRSKGRVLSSHLQQGSLHTSSCEQVKGRVLSSHLQQGSLHTSSCEQVKGRVLELQRQYAGVSVPRSVGRLDCG